MIPVEMCRFSTFGSGPTEWHEGRSLRAPSVGLSATATSATATEAIAHTPTTARSRAPGLLITILAPSLLASVLAGRLGPANGYRRCLFVGAGRPSAYSSCHAPSLTPGRCACLHKPLHSTPRTSRRFFWPCFSGGLCFLTAEGRTPVPPAVKKHYSLFKNPISA